VAFARLRRSFNMRRLRIFNAHDRTVARYKSANNF
jgi:hypothetical protein